jgi:hypothetical protein
LFYHRFWYINLAIHHLTTGLNRQIYITSSLKYWLPAAAVAVFLQLQARPLPPDLPAAAVIAKNLFLLLLWELPKPLPLALPVLAERLEIIQARQAEQAVLALIVLQPEEALGLETRPVRLYPVGGLLAERGALELAGI